MTVAWGEDAREEIEAAALLLLLVLLLLFLLFLLIHLHRPHVFGTSLSPAENVLLQRMQARRPSRARSI